MGGIARQHEIKSLCINSVEVSPHAPAEADAHSESPPREQLETRSSKKHSAGRSFRISELYRPRVLPTHARTRNVEPSEKTEGFPTRHQPRTKLLHPPEITHETPAPTRNNRPTM